MNHLKNLTIFILIVFSLSSNMLYAADLVWHENKEDVFKLAKKENKHIFLLVGNAEGTNCKKVIDHLNDESLRRIIDLNYVLWYSLRDDAEKQAEVKIYTEEYDTTATTLPFLYVINPEVPDKAVASKHGVQSVEELRQMISYSLTPRKGLKWYDNKEDVFKQAKDQNKYIFLLVGRSSCGNCKKVISQLNDENAPLKQIIEDNYILWYSLRDDPVIRTEVSLYTAEFDVVAQSLPFLYIINPEMPNKIVDSKWDYQNTQTLEDMLSTYLVDNEIIENQSENKVILFGDILQISNNTENEHINIYTTSGQLVSTIYKRDTEITINASDFPGGILIIHSSNEWSSKVIKR